MAGTVIALGMFDGVHMGHRALMARTVALANRIGATSMVYTFSNHPQEYFKRDVKLIMTEQRRRFFMKKMGIQEVIMVPFDEAMANMQPKSFLQMLYDKFDMRGVVAGYNYHFGQNASGGGQILEEFAEEMGVIYEQQPAVNYEGGPISSSRIRACIQEGKICEANEMLGDPFVLSGVVVENRGIGTSIGCPTANILPIKNHVLPKEGVYVTQTRWKGEVSASITNIGTNPTVGGRELSIETHLLDVDVNLYSTEIWVSFLQRVRDCKKFDSTDELAAQIQQDIAAARNFHKTPGLQGCRGMI